VFDLETYPIGQGAAASANLAFFRGRGTESNFGNIRDATGFEVVTENRLKLLAVSWGSVVDAFTGTELVTVDSNVVS
jgi:hypothetical protein